MANRVITISREFGSAGRTIGRRVALSLGIPCYDYELIKKIVEKSGLAEEYVRERGEYMVSSGFVGNVLSSRDHNGHSIQDELWAIEKQTIEDVAEKSSCVIVGRCAEYILRNKADLLTVFIHASMEKRAERIVNVYGENDISPEKRLRDKDKRRRAFFQVYTDLKWGDVANYQVALDSGILGVDKCVDIICSLY